MGPPFDPSGLGFERHSVFLTGDHVVFVFEGGQLDHLMRAVVKDPQMSVRSRHGSPCSTESRALPVRRTTGSGTAGGVRDGASESWAPLAPFDLGRPEANDSSD